MKHAWKGVGEVLGIAGYHPVAFDGTAGNYQPRRKPPKNLDQGDTDR